MLSDSPLGADAEAPAVLLALSLLPVLDTELGATAKGTAGFKDVFTMPACATKNVSHDTTSCDIVT